MPRQKIGASRAERILGTGGEAPLVQNRSARTFYLQEACSRALRPLPAPMPHESADAAPKTKGFPGDPFHDSFHAAGLKAASV